MVDRVRDPLTGLPYPESPLLKRFMRMPLLLWRLGLGPLIGRFLMILTTTGRKSGLPRRLAVEYHTYRGRMYVMSGWGDHTQWVKNIEADPRVTVQTVAGTQRVTARQVTSDAELAEVLAYVESNPAFQQWIEILGFDITREGLFARRDDFYLLTFDPTTEPTPPPLEADLQWVLPAAGAGVALAAVTILLLQRKRR